MTTHTPRRVAPHGAPHCTGVLLAIALLLASATALATPGTDHSHRTTVAGPAGSTVAITGWMIQSSAKAQQGGQAISTPGFSVKTWYPVSARTTVMAGLLQNGRYPDVFRDDNLRSISPRHFQIPWWYRATFRLPAADTGVHTFIKINGVIPGADLWLNGSEIASHAVVAGAYTTHTFDVTQLVHAGTNVLALRVHPASPERDLSLWFIDWNPAPPDNSMGIWRDVDIVRSGAVSLHDLHVVSRLDLPGLDRAALTVKARVRNDSDAPQDVVVVGHAAGVTLSRHVHLAPKQTRSLAFSPGTDPGLRMDHPRVWWPAGLGSQPLYEATLTARVNGATSDQSSTTFGIRDVRSHLTRRGYRQFVINGVPLLIRGAGWVPDMFLRDQPQRMATEFRYIRNLGLNAIRLEGKLERPDFYRLADRTGIMILAGWECCDKWEAWAGTGGAPWSAADRKIAAQSMTSEAQRLRDHPSVIAFLIGSDNAPPSRVAQIYVDALHAADWPDAIISAASAQKTAATGPAGMKMSGPYAWVPPRYWYADQVGGAFGFNSETSAGVDIPRLETLRHALAPRALQALWRDPDVKQYHASPFWSPFSSLQRFDTALAHRYGPPRSLADYVAKAQLANYATVRAQFEAYSAHMDAANPATGVIYWMLNSAWPSLHWHLIGHDLNPAGAYFGAQKANEPVHIQYSCDTRAVIALNHTRQPRRQLEASITVRDLDGKVRYSDHLANVSLPANHATRLTVIPKLKDLSATWFVELELTTADGRRVSRNVYWLSSHPDILNWAASTWNVTPVSRYADLTALQTLPATKVQLSAHTRRDGSHATTTVTITNAPGSRAMAFFVHLSIRQGADDKPILPVTWSSNDVTLWPGETATVTAHYQVRGGPVPVVRVAGWNVSPQVTATTN